MLAKKNRPSKQTSKQKKKKWSYVSNPGQDPELVLPSSDHRKGRVSVVSSELTVKRINSDVAAHLLKVHTKDGVLLDILPMHPGKGL